MYFKYAFIILNMYFKYGQICILNMALMWL
jgi:hypothetical protein